MTDDGDTAFEGVTSYQAGSFSFSGNPYITLGISNAILHEEFTYEAWYRADDNGTARALLNDNYGGSIAGVALVREATGALRAVITSGADDPQAVDIATPPLGLTPFSWHHVALTRADDRVASTSTAG